MFTTEQIQCSGSTGLGVHDQTESVFTIDWITHAAALSAVEPHGGVWHCQRMSEVLKLADRIADICSGAQWSTARCAIWASSQRTMAEIGAVVRRTVSEKERMMGETSARS